MSEDVFGKGYALYRGDCVEVLAQLPAGSVDFSVYSPPFSSLYIYSDSERDMGNCADDAEFFAHYAHALAEIHRVTKPGRLTAIHVKDLVYYRNQRGTAGLRDFTGGCIAAHLAAGFDLHSRVTIWRDPVREMQKTKAHGLLYKTLRTDAAHSRQGLPEYLVVFRKWARDGETEAPPVTHDPADFPLEQWQRWASPVWMDTRETDVLNVQVARRDRDEKHLCPMPLDLTERAVRLWSNPGDVVLSPFMGIGSEGVVSLRCGRRFVGVELKDSYFAQAVRNVRDAHATTAYGSLIDGVGAHAASQHERADSQARIERLFGGTAKAGEGAA